MEQHVILGTGAVGTALAQILVDQGKAVRSVNRSGNRGSLPTEVELVAADLADPAQASAAITGATVTYQVTQPAYHRWAQEFPALQASIIDAAAAAGSRLVIVDNLYAYGDPQGAPITEDSPQDPHTRKGKVRRALIESALAAHREGRLQVTVARPSNYFGPGYALTDDMVFGRAVAGKPMQWLGRADQPHSLSYVPDVARALATLGASDKSWGKVWIPPVAGAPTVGEFSQQVWEAAGQSGKAKVQAIRGMGLNLLAIFMPVLREAKEMMYEWEQPWIVDSSAFEREFGQTATPLDQAIRESLGAVKARVS
ncbi:MAG: NAD-dependent dehydratase [Actinobacteria bacterium HGW-Actinobacteria-4]|nr:MAG: NAD-dependent dehydratase [Actinobacteria bacterium HGW-Actinobacteria-4]